MLRKKLVVYLKEKKTVKYKIYAEPSTLRNVNEQLTPD